MVGNKPENVSSSGPGGGCTLITPPLRTFFLPTLGQRWRLAPRPPNGDTAGGGWGGSFLSFTHFLASRALRLGPTSAVQSGAWTQSRLDAHREF